MEDELIRAFCSAKYEAKAGLSQDIWRTIINRQARVARLKLWIFSAVGIGSIIGIVPVFKVLASDLAQSSFYEYLSLVFSSNKTLTLHWRESAFSLAQSLPTISLALSLALVFILFLSIKYAMRQVAKGQLLFSPA